MSWLKLNSEFLYLMKGGVKKYIDKVAITQIPLEEDNTKATSGFVDFPYGWFTSTQRPQTIIVNPFEKDEVAPFSTNTILKFLEVPISYKLFKELKEADKVSSLIEIFIDNVGRFSDDFYQYKHSDNQLYRVLIPGFSDAEEISLEPKDFPTIIFNPDPDDEEEDPAFSQILFGLVLKRGYTVRPVLLKTPGKDSKIQAQLGFIKQPGSGLTRSSKVVSVSTLEKAVEPREFASLLNSQPDLKSVLKKLSEIIPSDAESQLLSKTADIAFDGLDTFTEVMDKICRRYSTVWDWQGDSAYIFFP